MPRLHYHRERLTAFATLGQGLTAGVAKEGGRVTLTELEMRQDCLFSRFWLTKLHRTLHSGVEGARRGNAWS